MGPAFASASETATASEGAARNARAELLIMESGTPERSAFTGATQLLQWPAEGKPVISDAEPHCCVDSH